MDMASYPKLSDEELGLVILRGGNVPPRIASQIASRGLRASMAAREFLGRLKAGEMKKFRAAVSGRKK